MRTPLFTKEQFLSFSPLNKGTSLIWTLYYVPLVSELGVFWKYFIVI